MSYTHVGAAHFISSAWGVMNTSAHRLNGTVDYGLGQLTVLPEIVSVGEKDQLDCLP